MDFVSWLGFTVSGYLLAKNPVVNVRLPAQRTGRKRNKLDTTPGQFDELVARVSQPCASMIYVVVYTGLRVSEHLRQRILRWTAPIFQANL